MLKSLLITAAWVLRVDFNLLQNPHNISVVRLLNQS